MKVGIKWDLE